MTGIVLFGLFLLLLILGTPIGVSIGISVVGALTFSGFGDALWIIPEKLLTSASNSALLAVPLFVLAGNLMNAIGITKRIFNLATALVGHLRGGLAQVNVLASLMLAGGTGAAVADIAGLGAVEIEAMKERGYTPAFSSAITVVSAVVAPFIPPSVPLVVYAYLSNQSVARMFLAGIVPGILIVCCLMLFNRLLAQRLELPREPKATAKEVWKHTLSGVAALFAPAIIMGGILTGTTTASEAGVLASGYVLFLGVIFRTLTIERLWTALTETVLISSLIMIIIGFAASIGWLLAIEQIPQDLARAIPELIHSRFAFLCVVMAMLLLMGCFMDGITIKLLLLPILLPLVDTFGIDRVHFGIILLMSLILGIATPPLGIGLFITSRISGAPLDEIVRAVLPYFAPLLIATGLILFIPAISLWLPNLVLGPEF